MVTVSGATTANSCTLVLRVVVRGSKVQEEKVPAKEKAEAKEKEKEKPVDLVTEIIQGQRCLCKRKAIVKRKIKAVPQ